MTASRIAPLAGGVLALLALGAWFLSRSDARGTIAPPADAGRIAVFERQIEALRSELDEARAERLALAEEVEWLRKELDSLASADAPPPEEAVAVSETEPSGPRVFAVEKPLRPLGTGVFDEASLRELGFSPSEVSRLRESFESSKMEELYLRDRATREGWINKPRFKRELEKVRNELRNSLSDDEFDRMLYASGTKNRVVLTRVLYGSPARDAGLVDGDVVLSYDDVRIFEGRELQLATTTSTSSLTPMVVERDGVSLRFFVPPGPLGVQLEMRALAPYP